MTTISIPQAGEPCPHCGGAFVEHREPTPEERAAAEDHEQRRPYPPRVDTAPAAQRAELGPLLECQGCHYKTRLTPTLDEQLEARSRRRSRRQAPGDAGTTGE